MEQPAGVGAATFHLPWSRRTTPRRTVCDDREPLGRHGIRARDCPGERQRQRWRQQRPVPPRWCGARRSGCDSPYSIQWDATALADGTHTLTAKPAMPATTSGPLRYGHGPEQIVVTEGPRLRRARWRERLNPRGRRSGAQLWQRHSGINRYGIEMWIRPDSVQVRHQILGKSGECRVAIIYGTVMVECATRARSR